MRRCWQNENKNSAKLQSHRRKRPGGPFAVGIIGVDGVYPGDAALQHPPGVGVDAPPSAAAPTQAVGEAVGLRGGAQQLYVLLHGRDIFGVDAPEDIVMAEDFLSRHPHEPAQ